MTSYPAEVALREVMTLLEETGGDECQEGSSADAIYKRARAALLAPQRDESETYDAEMCVQELTKAVRRQVETLFAGGDMDAAITAEMTAHDNLLRAIRTIPNLSTPAPDPAKPLVWIRTLNGKIDWGDDCICDDGQQADLCDGYDKDDPDNVYEAVPLYTHPAPDPVGMDEIEEAITTYVRCHDDFHVKCSAANEHARDTAYNALLSAISLLAQGGQSWQPIETAKDGNGEAKSLPERLLHEATLTYSYRTALLLREAAEQVGCYEWVPVKDRLPERHYSAQVLAMHLSGAVTVEPISHVRLQGTTKFSHWQPLPTPPTNPERAGA